MNAPVISYEPSASKPKSFNPSNGSVTYCQNNKRHSVCETGLTALIESSSPARCSKQKEVRFCGARSVDSCDSNNSPNLVKALSKIFQGSRRQSVDDDCIELLFPDPRSDEKSLKTKVQTSNIALEGVTCRFGCVKGVVRVRNVAAAAKNMSQSVFVRLTFNSWTHMADWMADRVAADTNNDEAEFSTFEFVITVPPHLVPGSIIQFAICCRCEDSNGQRVEFWDNNGGSNYSVRYLPPNGSVCNIASAAQTLPSSQMPAVDLNDERVRKIRELVHSEFAPWNNSQLSATSKQAKSVLRTTTNTSNTFTSTNALSTPLRDSVVPFW